MILDTKTINNKTVGKDSAILSPNTLYIIIGKTKNTNTALNIKSCLHVGLLFMV